MSDPRGMTAIESDGLEVVLGRVDQEPSYPAYQRAGRLLEAVQAPGEGGITGAPSARPIRVALLGSATVEPLAAYVRVEAYRFGLAVECFTASYERYRHELLDPASGLRAFHPDIVFLDLEPESLVPAVGPEGLTPAHVEAVLKELAALITGFRGHSSSPVVLHNFVNPGLRPYAIVKMPEELAHDDLNRRLEKRFSPESNVVVLDVNGLAAYHGLGRVRGGPLRYLGGMRWSESFLPVLAKSYATVLKAARGATHKCLVLDLDNTLWGGVVGEAGPDGIVLDTSPAGLAYLDFQRAILQLWRRGVLLAISSKNNPEDALAVIRKHPHMILREEHFASIRIGWDPKPEQLRRIAADLNIGTDSLVFLDDDPVECAQVRHYLPEVCTIQLPSNPGLYAETVLLLTQFEQLALTGEDLHRNRMYAEQRRREAFRAEVGTFEDFLRGLKMVVEIGVDDVDDVDRVALLTQKTNQFNLTTKRYSQAEVRRAMESSSAHVYTLRLRDRFGDSGLTGVAITRQEGRIWTIDTFLLSCRIIGKKVETVLLNEILRDAHRAGVELVRGQYVPTEKNRLVAGFYSQHGFQVEEAASGTWTLNNADFSREAEPWVTIQRRRTSTPR